MSEPLEIEAALAALAAPEQAAAAGSGAALAGALAAAVVAKVARLSDRSTASAQAIALQTRLSRYAQVDAIALREARAALAGSSNDGGAPQRDFALGTAMRRAMDVPCAIGEACTDVAELAAAERDSVLPDHRADLAAAAAMAAGAAHAAAHLVTVNLIATPEDEAVVAARAFSARAVAVARLFGGI